MAASSRRQRSELERRTGAWLAQLAHRKGVIIVIMIAAVAFGVFRYFRSSIYEAKATLLIQKVQNSPLQELSAGMTQVSMGGMSPLGKDLYLEKYLLYFGSRDFRLTAARRLLGTEDASRILTALGYSARPKERFLDYFMNRPEFENESEESYAGKKQSAVAGLIARRCSFVKNGSAGVDLRVATGDPWVSVAVAQILADVAIEMVVAVEQKELDEAKAYLTSKLKQAETGLKEISVDQVDIRRRTPSTALSGKIAADERLFAIERELEADRIAYSQTRKIIGLLEKQLEANKASGSSDEESVATADTLVVKLSTQVEALERRRLQMMMSGVEKESKLVKGLNAELTKAKKQLADARENEKVDKKSLAFLNDGTPIHTRLLQLQNEALRLATLIESSTQALSRLNASRRNVPEDEQLYFDLSKRSEFQYMLFAELSKQLFHVDIQRISIQNKIALIEAPSLDLLERRPTLFASVVSCVVVGILFIAVLIVALERFYRLVYGSDDLVDLEVEFLGAIPPMRRRKGDGLGAGSLIRIRHDLDSPTANVFKQIRTRLLMSHRLAPGESRVISVHSAVSGEGKSLVSSNLSMSLALLGRPTLLIDADLRGSSLTVNYSKKPTQGLSTALLGLHPVESGIEKNLAHNLDFLPAGPFYERTTEILQGAAFASLLESLKSRYEFIILDTPPTLPVPDSLTIASFADNTVVIACCNKTRLADLESTVERLGNAVDRPLQVILNRSDQMPSFYYARSNRLARQPVEPAAPNAPRDDDQVARTRLG